MLRRDLEWCLGLQVFAIVWAGTLFNVLPSRFLAGLLAGLYFIGSGILMLVWLRRWPRPWLSLTQYALLVHVFLISIPMVVTRLIHMNEDFASVHIYGLPGPEFHRLSTGVFSVLMGATVIDWVRCLWASRMRAPKV